MTDKEKVQTKLLEAGFNYLRLCDTESTSPEIMHYTLEKDLGVDSNYCPINSYTEIGSDKGLRIIDCFLNPSLIHPNPLDI